MGDSGIFREMVISHPPTEEQAERQDRRKHLFFLLLVILICLGTTILGMIGLWRAWQNGRWDDSYWVDSFLIQVCGPLMTALSSSVGLTLYFSRLANEKAKDQQGKPANWRISTTLIAFSPLLLVVLFAATAFSLQTYQSYSYHALLAQIRAHKPLYSHLLAEFPADYYYVKGFNHLPLDAPAFQAPGSYGDDTVEVTVRLLGKESSYGQSSDRLALLLHSDSTEAGIMFQISPNGDWSIGRPDDEYKDKAQTYLHHTSAIHTAPGAYNRLTVIMRANQYICFVNNQFVGIYQDSGSPVGPIGLDVETDTASVAFTDFTIYPL